MFTFIDLLRENICLTLIIVCTEPRFISLKSKKDNQITINELWLSHKIKKNLMNLEFYAKRNCIIGLEILLSN